MTEEICRDNLPYGSWLNIMPTAEHQPTWRREILGGHIIRRSLT